MSSDQDEETLADVTKRVARFQVSDLVSGSQQSQTPDNTEAIDWASLVPSAPQSALDELPLIDLNFAFDDTDVGASESMHAFRGAGAEDSTCGAEESTFPESAFQLAATRPRSGARRTAPRRSSRIREDFFQRYPDVFPQIDDSVDLTDLIPRKRQRRNAGVNLTQSFNAESENWQGGESSSMMDEDTIWRAADDHHRDEIPRSVPSFGDFNLPSEDALTRLRAATSVAVETDGEGSDTELDEFLPGDEGEHKPGSKRKRSSG